MAFTIIPTSVAGVQLPFNQLKGPLSALWAQDTKPNLYYPQDIGTNPAHCHVCQITVFEYTTDFEQSAVVPLQNLSSNSDALKKVEQSIKDGFTQLKDIESRTNLSGVATQGLDLLQKAYAAKTYKPKPGGDPLAFINLYMPDSLSVDYNASYSSISMTQVMGIGGKVSSAISEMGGGAGIVGKPIENSSQQFLNTNTAKYLGIQAAGKILPGSQGLGDVMGQAAHQILNPQLQLMYQGVDFREFQLDFIFTPKSSYEAQQTKQIIDTLVYYSSPDIATTDSQGQFLVPPQLFNIKFLFTGKNGIEGALGAAFTKAFTNIGLDFLATDANRLSENAEQNINKNLFNIGNCVLKDISVDYAPNGWAAFDDGHPVQTRMSLRFQETDIVTKQRLRTEGKTGNAFDPTKFQNVGF